MSDQSDPRTPPMPPPVPQSQPPTIAYAGRMPQPPVESDAQRVFDTVAGPNVRLVDNLVQLACVVAGGGIGAAIGWFIAGPSDGGQAYLVIGGIVGVLVGLVVSGVVIGIVRGRNAMRRRPR